MNVVWAPWRMEYIENQTTDGCLFCKKLAESNDEENYILYRNSLSFIIINTFPYNNGHLMVVPNRHVADISLLDKNDILSTMLLVQKGVSALSEVLKPNGFNIGINIGMIAGAGIAEHLHIHIVPRWQGDTNFMPVISDTKIMPQHLRKTYDTLLPFFQK